MKKSVLSGLVALALLVPQVEAASIGRSVSRPVVSSVKASSTTIASKGISGGGSMGVSKPDVMAKARVPSTVPQPSYQQNYATPVPKVYQPLQQQQPAGLGAVGGSFVGSLGGSLVGSMLGNAISRPQQPAYATTTSQQVPVPQQAAGVVAYQNTSSYGLFSLLSDLLLLAFLVFLIYLAYKWYSKRNKDEASKLVRVVKEKYNKAEDTITSFNTSKTSLTSVPEASLEQFEMFTKIQTAFSTHDRVALSSMLTKAMLDQVTFEGMPSLASFKNIQAQELDNWKFAKSIRYKALDLETNEQLDEVWHFKLENNQWMLEGIEQV